MSRRIFIGIPSHRATTDARMTLAFGASMAALHSYPRLEVVGISVVAGTSVDEARNALLQEAIDAHADLLLMIDDDSWFIPAAPWEMIEAALAHGATVAGLAAPKRDGEPNVEVDDGRRDGFSPCWRVGGGVMVVDVAAVIRLGRPRPWFVSTPQARGGLYTEDYFFCDSVRAAGGTVFVDWRNPAGNGDLHF